MDGTWYFWLMLPVLAGVWWLDNNRRRLVRKAKAKGAEWGDQISEKAKVDHLPGALGELGRSVVLVTDQSSALALVDAVVDSKRLYRKSVPGVWHIDLVRPDDLVVTAVPTPTGTEVVLTSLRDDVGFPAGGLWTQFLDRLVKAADKQGIAVEERTGAAYESRTVEGEPGQTWLRA